MNKIAGLVQDIVLDPHPTAAYMAELRHRAFIAGMVAAERVEQAVDADVTERALRAEIRFRETGECLPLRVGHRWVVARGGSWVDVDPPADLRAAFRRSRVGVGVA